MSRIHFRCLVALVTGLVIAPLVGCGGGDSAPPASIESSSTAPSTGEKPAAVPQLTAARPTAGPTAGPAAAPVPPRTRVRFTTSMGEITVRLHNTEAPATVMNFLQNYVEPGFYSGSMLHYVDDKMIIGGGFMADGQPKSASGWIRNESDNGLSNRKGTIAMARDPDYPDSAMSQFFFNLQDNADFDHRSDLESADVGGNGYCVFGEVVGGMEVLAKISQVPVEDGQFTSSPVQRVIVQSVVQLN